MSQKFIMPKAFDSCKGSTVLPVSQFSTLKAGRHIVGIFAVLALMDYEKVGRYDPSTKSYPVQEKEGFLEKREWLNNSSQLAVVFKNDKGVITEYYNLQGFFTPDEIITNIGILRSPEVMKANDWKPEFAQQITATHITGKKSGDATYACVNTKKGSFRIVSPEKTAQCHSILSQVLVASGEEVGEDLYEAIENMATAVLDGEDLQVDIEVVERKLSPDVKSRMLKELDSVFEVKRVRMIDLDADFSGLTTASAGAPSLKDELADLL